MSSKRPCPLYYPIDTHLIIASLPLLHQRFFVLAVTDGEVVMR